MTIPGGVVPELQGAVGYSLTMWFNTGADIVSNRYLVEWLQEFVSPYSGMTLGYQDSQLRLWLGTGWGDVAPLTANTWYHVAVAKQAGQVEVYLNGSLAYTSATVNLGSQVSEIVTGAGTFPGAGSYTAFHEGAIAQLMIYEGAVDESTIAEAYQADEHLYVSSAALPTGLVQLSADRADGTNPYPIPGASSPWVDLIGPHDATLTSFAGSASSGWAGDGTAGAPYILMFDGVDDRVTIPAASVPALQAALATSVELWFRTGSDITSNQYLFEWLDTFASPFAGMTVGMSNGNLQVFLNPWSTIATVQPNTWYHVVVTKRANQVRAYIDGDLAFEATNDNLGDQNSEIAIGASTFRGTGIYGEYFGGSIARVTVYHGTLRADDIRSLYLEVQPDGILGGALFDRFWAVETGYHAPAGIDLESITAFPEFYRCKSCHSWDRKGHVGAYIGRGPTLTRPNVADIDLTTSLSASTRQEVFDFIKNVGGRDVDPALTSDGTNGLGDAMPDYGKILTDGEIWSLVEFLKKDAVDTEQLYDLSTTGSYPNGTAEFLNIGLGGDDVAGNSFFQANCSNCHGATGLLFPGLSNPDKSVGSVLRSEPYELQHLLKFGNLGTSMLSFPTISVETLQDLYALFADPAQFPDPLPVGAKFVELRADQGSGTGSHPVPGAASPWVDLANAHHGVLNNFGGSTVSGWQGDGTPSSPYRLEFDGSDDFVAIPGATIPELQGGGSYSLGMWFRTGTDVSTARYLIEWVEQLPPGAPWSGMTVRVAAGNIDLWRGPDDGGFGTLFSGVQPNTWYHLVVTKQPGLAAAYVNGVASGTFATPNSGDQNTDIIIGGGIYSGNPPESVPWLGAIAQLTLYSGAIDGVLVLDEFEADEASYFSTGACCNGFTGTCTDDLLASDCQALEETWTAETACANLVPPCEDIMIFVFEDGLAGYGGTHDTYLQEGLPAAINGELVAFEWDGLESASNAPTYALLRFDDLFSGFGGPLAPGATLLSATLTYTIPLSGDQSPAGDAGSMHRIAAGVAWDEASVSFNNFGGDAGIQLDEYLASGLTVPGGPLGPISVDVTADVAAWLASPADNRGWVILPTANDGTVVSSSESPSEAAERPRLTIAAAATAAACTMPAECNDGNVCNGIEDCVGQVCVPGSSLSCDDGDSCTADSCDPLTGCTSAAIDCDDGVSCTTDSCDQLVGCENIDNCPLGQICNHGSNACLTPQALPLVVGDTWRYRKGLTEPEPGDLTAWTRINYNDGAWLQGPSSFGYGTDCPPFGTQLNDMQNGYRSVYMRHLFSISDPAAVTELTLTMDYDDAFVAYINGTEVARNNVSGAPPTYTQLATSDHECSGSPLVANPPEDYAIHASFDLTSLLVPGANVLAVQGHNLSDDSSDFTILSTMNSVEDVLTPQAPVISAVGSRYLAVTPPPGHGSVALRVESDELPCLSRYIDGAGLLVDDPVFQSSAAWSTVFVGDEDIIPSTTYQVRADVRLPVEPPNLSEPISTTTWRWGDGDDDDLVDITDIVCTLDGFRDVFNVCLPESVDLQGAVDAFVPDRNIDIVDIVAALDAFTGVAYPGPLPCIPPAPQAPAEPLPTARVTLIPREAVVRPGGTVAIDVFVSAVEGLRAYQVNIELGRGHNGDLLLKDLWIDEDRDDYVFTELSDFPTISAATQRMGNALLSGAVDTREMRYLGTFEVQASKAAAGSCSIAVGSSTLLLDSAGRPFDMQTSTDTDIWVSVMRKR